MATSNANLQYFGELQPQCGEFVDCGFENPFENTLILDTLFRVCDLADLRRFRLVNWKWYNQSLARWRREMEVRIDEGKGFLHYQLSGRLGICTARDMLAVPDFFGKPYCKFRLGFSSLSFGDRSKRINQPLPSSEDYEYFWTTFGPYIKYLTIWTYEPVPEWKLATWLMKKTPNLESLVLTSPDLDWFTVTDELVQTSLKSIELDTPHTPWDLILEKFPCIQNIKLGGAYSSDLQKILDVFMKIQSAGKTGRVLRLSFENCIYGDEDTPDVLTRLLQFPNVKVKELSLGRGGDVDLTNNLISTCSSISAECLDSLSLVEDYPEDVYRVERLLMNPAPMLTYLYVDCKLINSLHFLQDTVNLRRLYLEYIQHKQLDSTSVIQMAKCALQQLDTLVIAFEDDEDYLRESDVRLIATLAPNMKNFECALDNASFRRLCALLPDIRRLTVQSVRYNTTCFDNYGLTGIREGTTVLFPNLTTLKHLEEFSYKNENLSDTSIWNGFLIMTYLWKLKVTLSWRTSDAAFEALCKRYPSQTVKRGDYSHGNPSQELNDKLSRKSERLHKLYRI